MQDEKVVLFSDASKAIEEMTGIEGIDLFPGIRRWKAAQAAEKLAGEIPPELRGLVARKLLGAIARRLLGRSG